MQSVLDTLLEGTFDEARHPRGLGGRFIRVMHALDDLASSGRPGIGKDGARQALTNVAIAQHLHAGGDERGAYDRLKLAHQKLGAGGGGMEMGHQRANQARLGVINLMSA